jgi:hypothetical protein
MKAEIRSSDSWDYPARSSYPVTPSNTVEIGPVEPKGVWVGGAGTIVGQLVGDTADRTFAGITAGSLLPLRFRLIKSTGTTATNIVAVY